jgi:quinol monooxygenase YgiN
MTEPKVFLDGHIDVPQERIDTVSEALPAHIALTRAEPGCLSFDVKPCATVAGRFLVAEVFANQAAFDAHQVRTKASDWFQVTDGIAREYKIRVEAV